MINDGDTIKIGEYTPILVGIDMGESRLRRNPKGGREGGELDDMVGAGVGHCGQLAVAVRSGVVEVAPLKRNLRGRSPKGGDSKYEIRVSTRRTGRRKMMFGSIRRHLERSWNV